MSQGSIQILVEYCRDPMARRALPKTERARVVMFSNRIPAVLKERLERVSAATKVPQQDIVISALVAELDVRETFLAERVAAIETLANIERREDQARAQSKRERIETHIGSSTRGKAKSAKRIPKSP